MTNTQQFKQLLTPISRLTLIVAFLLPAPLILISTLAVGQPLKPGSPLYPDNSNPNQPHSRFKPNGTCNIPPQGPYRDSQGRFARDPSGTKQTRDREREFNDVFRREQAHIIASDESHPLRFLLDEKGKLVQDVQAGHTMMHASGRRGMLALEDKSLNENSYQELQALKQGKPLRKEAIEIRGATVELNSAKKWENEGKLPKGTVENALSRPGWTTDLKINDRGVDVAEATGRFSEAQIQRLREIATSDDAINRLSPKDRQLYRDYYQALMDSRPNRRMKKAAPSFESAREAPLFARQGTSDSAVSPTGALPKLLSGSEVGGAATSTPGGIDFSTLELRYLAEDSGPFADRGLRYAFSAVPASGNKNLNAGRTAAVQASDSFFVWLSLSPDKFWVNLNPDEPNRIIDPQLGTTDAGRILLQADLQMKKTVARLIHPDTALGKQFWKQLNRNGSQTCLSFRQWIVPAPATIREEGDGIYIQNAPLDVKMDSQYFKTKGLSGFLESCPTKDQSTQSHNESVFRKLILPRIVQAVNTEPEYAALRQVYRSRVAAEWYRQRSTSQATNYRDLVNHGDVSSWPAQQKWSPRQVFDQFVNSYKKGEFHVAHKWRKGNYIYTNVYVFGGVDFTKVLFKTLNSTDFQEKWGDLPKVVNASMAAPVADHYGKIWLGGSATTPGSESIWESIWFYLGLGTLGMLFLICRTRAHGKRRR